MRARLRRATAAALVTLVGLAATAASTMAGTVSVSGSAIVYVDGDGQWQDLYAAQDGGTYYFLDFRVPLSAGTGCTPNVGPPLGAYTVKCEGVGITSVEVDAGGGNDDVNMGSVAVHSDVDGGAGNDHLTGGFGDDTLHGGDGDDRLDDGAISGAPPAGDDVFLGGPGSDTVSYQAAWEPVSVTLDGVADDGVAGSADNAGIDVENIIGGGAADVLTGNASANRIEAGSGLAADTLNGLDGDDSLMGEGGDGDVLNGGGADDRLDGGWGADTANGGAGDDTFEDTGLINGSLDDTFNGGAGIDTADYGDRFGRVVADLDGEIGDDGELARDTQPAEHDTLGADVEDLIGGRADDALTGNGSDNLLVGGLCTQPGPAGCLADALHGAAGDDALIVGAEDSNCGFIVCGTQGTGILDGGTGDDVLIAVYGRAEMAGGEGDDDLSPAPAGDIEGSDLSGGPGRDSVDFSTAAEPVSVSLDNLADDGPQGADENTRADIEDIVGGDFDDLLIGHAEANQFDGGEGDDILAGGPGPDHLSGGRARMSPTTPTTNRPWSCASTARAAPAASRTAPVTRCNRTWRTPGEARATTR